MLGHAGVPHVDGDDPKEGVRRKFQKTNSTMPNNTFSMNHALKSLPGYGNVYIVRKQFFDLF